MKENNIKTCYNPREFEAYKDKLVRKIDTLVSDLKRLKFY